MSIQAAVPESNTDAALSAFIRATDTYYMYWRGVLSSELMSTADEVYAETLRAMLDRLDSDLITIPKRCRMCGQYYDQPLPSSGPWRKFCTSYCCGTFHKNERHGRLMS